jgi:hypothetical protein
MTNLDVRNRSTFRGFHYIYDSTFFKPDNSNIPFLAAGEPLGWGITTQKATGRLSRYTFIQMMDTIDSLRIITPSIFSTWGRNDVGGFLYPLTVTDFVKAANFTWDVTTNYSIGVGGFNGTITNPGNSYFGVYAGSNDTSENNTYVGYGAGSVVDASGANNTAVGSLAGSENGGQENTFIGYLSGSQSSGNVNSALGERSAYQSTGAYNAFFGWSAGYLNNGNYNTGFGPSASENMVGDSNIFIGLNSGFNTTANNCIGIGWQALRQDTADNVIAIGFDAGLGNTTSNLFILKQNNLNTTPLMQGNLLTNLLTVQKLEADTLLRSNDSLYVAGNAEFENQVNCNSAVDISGALTAQTISMNDPSQWMDDFRKRPFYMHDFLNPNATTVDPWFGVSVASGTFALPSGVTLTDHPGVQSLKSSTTTNSGYFIMSGIYMMEGLDGDEITNLVFHPNVLDSVTTRFGFHDATTVTAPVDGAYFEVGPDSVLWGKTMNASSGSTTGTSYTLAINTWYRLKLVVNAAATRVDYYLYNAAGAVLWTDNLQTNIPTGYLGHGLITTKAHTGTGAGIVLLNIDYMDVYLGTLTR